MYFIDSHTLPHAEGISLLTQTSYIDIWQLTTCQKFETRPNRPTLNYPPPPHNSPTPINQLVNQPDNVLPKARNSVGSETPGAVPTHCHSPLAPRRFIALRTHGEDS